MADKSNDPLFFPEVEPRRIARRRGPRDDDKATRRQLARIKQLAALGAIDGQSYHFYDATRLEADIAIANAEQRLLLADRKTAQGEQLDPPVARG